MLLISPTEFDDQTKDYLLKEAEQFLYELGKGIDVDAFLSSVRELMFNVVQHSGEEGGVFALEADKRLVVARVEDGGVGIHHNMSQAHPGLSEPETLIKALERGGTSTGYAMRGFGLFWAVVYTEETSGALLVLTTGEVACMAMNGEPKLISTSGDFHQGVIAELSVAFEEVS